MKTLQRRVLKNVGVSMLLILTALMPSEAQSSFRLRTADSLYNAKQYTQSFDHYQEILRQKQYTPSMLLKMAYIQEGLNNIGQAMYYLNLYFLASNDDAVLPKMAELAEKFDLRGYETDETDQLLVYYHDHYDAISLALAALTLLAASFIFYTKVKREQRPVLGAVLLLLVAIAFFAHLNFGERVTRGILAGNSNYIMNGPSAAASIVSITPGGHRVEVVGRNDVWLKIRWNDDTAYIRENSLLTVEL